jgi:hypothetical protein
VNGYKNNFAAGKIRLPKIKQNNNKLIIRRLEWSTIKEKM